MLQRSFAVWHDLYSHDSRLITPAQRALWKMMAKMFAARFVYIASGGKSQSVNKKKTSSGWRWLMEDYGFEWVNQLDTLKLLSQRRCVYVWKNSKWFIKRHSIAFWRFIAFLSGNPITAPSRTDLHSFVIISWIKSHEIDRRCNIWTYWAVRGTGNARNIFFLNEDWTANKKRMVWEMRWRERMKKW